MARDTRDLVRAKCEHAVNTATLEPFAGPTYRLALRRTGDRSGESLTGGSACCAASLKRAARLR